MSVSTTNLASLAYVAETVPGTIPTSPAFQLLPVLSIDLLEKIVGVASEAITGNRMKGDIVIVDADVGGDSNYELSYTPWKPLMIALLQQGGTADAAVAISASDISAVASGGTFESSGTNFVTENVAVGQWLKVAGFTESKNNGIFRITAVASGAITIDSTLHPDGLTDEAIGDAVTMKSDMYRNGSSVIDTFSMRKRVYVGATPYYFYYPGCIVNSMSFAMTTASIITGAMNMVGTVGEGTASPKSGETTVVVPEYHLLNATSSVGATYLSSLTTAVFNSLSLNVNNNMTAKKGIGTLGALDQGAFDFEVIVDCELYFEDLTLYNNFKNSTGFITAVEMTDSAGNSIVMSMPNCKFLNLTEPIPGKNNFLMESGQIESLADPTLGCNFQLDFMSA
jgi:hypothetical protein